MKNFKEITMRYKKQGLMAFLFLLFISTNSMAGIIPFHQRLQDTVCTGGKDTLVHEVSPRSGSFKDQSVLNFVTAGVDPDYMKYVRDSAVYKIFVTIEGYDSSLSLIAATNHTFTVVYDPFGKTASRDKDIYAFSGAYKVKVTFTGATQNGSSISCLPDYVYIDSDIEVERYYNFAAQATTLFTLNTASAINLDCDTASIPDELELSWNTCLASNTICPESYELEWTFVNDYDSVTGAYKMASAINYDFRGNSTRIQTAANSYRISLIYEHGYILYRVRGIGKDTSDPTKTIVGVWSQGESGTVGSASDYYYNTQTHEGDKNWQYSASYAEEGKKKEVVSYFDGSLRNRQSVTKMNSNKNTLVGETIYDHEGRPAVNVLPVPVDGPTCTDSSEAVIMFYPNFNRDDSSLVYSRNDFDVDSGGCMIAVKPMNTGYGASHYYSPNNPNKDAQQAFVPDAKKYPFTQVEYTPDNTGRIKRQSGVGSYHQLNTGHETQYFYGQPTQVELDRMFGSEVGDATHYKKNVVLDANSQVSLSYLDMEGRTIATALAGDSAHGLSKLASNSTPDTLTADLFNKNALGQSSLNTVNIAGNALVFNSQLLVSYPANHIFSYSLTVDTLADSCLRSNVCFSCVYDLQLRVYDDCGTDRMGLKYGDSALNRTIGHFTLDSLNRLVFTDSCLGGTSFSATDTLMLETGNYTVSKILTVNPDAVNFYVGKYLDTTDNSCFRNLDDFVQAALSNVDTSNCHITCQSCLDKLGDRDSFVAAGIGTYIEYDALADACQEPCKAKSDCYVRYLQMVADMYPGGQYGEYLDNSGNINPAAFPLSVYDTLNKLPKNLAGTDTAQWHHPRITLNNTTYYYYVDDNGNISTINISKSGNNYVPAVVDTSSLHVQYDTATQSYYTYPANLANLSDFVNNWQPSWAKSLVYYHPEYCYYESCQGFGTKATGDYTTSDEFDALLQSTTTFTAAVAAGFVKYNYATQAYSARMNDFTDVNDSLPYDPFLTTPTYSVYASQLSALLTNYTPKPYTIAYNFSMHEIAAFYTRCGTLYGSHDTSGCLGFGGGSVDSVKNHEWQTFVGLYLSHKQVLQQQYLDAQVKSSGCPGYSACFGDSSNSFSPSALGSQYTNLAQPCGLTTGYLYANKTRRYGGASFYVSANTDEGEYQFYLQSGQCPMAYNLQSLLAQIAQNGHLKYAAHDTLGHYTTFSHDIYAALGGSSSFNSPFYFTSSNSGAVISCQVKDNLDTTVCTITIDASTAGLSSFNGYYIKNVTGLADSSNYSDPNAFRVYLALQDTVTDSVTYKMALGSTTCFSINNCKFTEQCTPNDFASDLQKLMNALASNHVLGTDSVKLNTTTYSPYVTASIKNQLGTSTTGKLVWKYNNSLEKFELYDSLNTSVKLLIDLGGDTSAIATNGGTYFAYIYGFSGINSNYYNNFTITALDSIDGSFEVDGAVLKRSISGTDTSFEGVSLGSCGYPTSFNCVGTSYKLQNDLQLLLRDVLTKMPAGHDVDLTKLPSYSNVIANALPPGLDSTSSVLVTNTSGWGNYKTQLLFTVKSASDSCYFSLNADTLHAFDSIVDFEKLTAYGATDGNGNYHQFYGIATYSINDSLKTDTIFGQSCLPLLNCCACGTNDTVTQNLPYQPTDTCYALYQQLLDSIQAFNTSAFAIATGDSIKISAFTYYDIAYFGYCNCVSSYITYLMNYSDTSQGPAIITDPSFTACPGYKYDSNADQVCEKNYGLYYNAVRNFNHEIAGISLSIPKIDSTKYDEYSFNNSGFCNCYPAYIAYLNGILTHAIPVNAIDTSLLDIANFCQDNFQPPCQAYVAPDTNSIFSTGYPVTVPPDTSCAQYAMNIAALNGQNQYNQYYDSLTTNIATKYVAHCLGAVETFTDKYPDKQYHFTLYYYDQAGNLVRTVPPQGVNLTGVTGPPNVPITTPASAADSICWDRTFGTHLYPTDHTLPTTYQYNSLNQLIKQSMPDHDPLDIWEYTLPNGLNSKLKITGIQFINEHTGYLTGYVDLDTTILPGISRRGYLYTSTNGGKNWSQMPNLAASDLNKIQMVTTNTGYAVGKNGLVLKTIDKGISWDIVPTYGEYTGTWNYAPEWKDLYFKDSVRGIITGTNGKSLMIDLTQASPANYMKTISLPGDSLDILTGVTYDGSLAYASAIGHDGHGYLYQSNVDPFTYDSLQWVPVTGITSSDLLDVQFLTAHPDTGFASGIKGTLLKTKDAGASWEAISTGLGTDIESVFFRNDSVGVALVDSSAGKAKMYKTNNGGRSWTLMSSAGKHYSALAPYACSNNATKDKAFAVGDNGVVHRLIATTNVTAPYYGNSPYFGLGILSSPNVNVNFKCVATATYTNTVARPRVIIGADNGTLYYSKVADSTVMVWDSLALVSTPIKKIALKLTGTNNDMQAVAIDTNGVIYGIDIATGDTSMLTFAVTPRFADVVYNSSAGRFYAFDDASHQLYYLTFSGGMSPHIVITAVNSNGSIGAVKAMAFAGNHLLVVGDEGTIFKDSLATGVSPSWKDKSASLKILPLTDVQIDGGGTPALYATGYSGTLLQKAPAGSWKKIATPCTSNFNAIKFNGSSSSDALAVGDNGSIYKVGVDGSYNVTLAAAVNTTGITQNLNDLAISSGSAIIVGNNGAGLAASVTVSTPTATATSFGTITQNLMGITLTGSKRMIVGQGNCVFTFGGGAMARITSLYTQSLAKAHFATAGNGYVVGDNGFIRHTGDGVSWSVVLPRMAYAHLDTMLSVYTYEADKAILLGKDSFMAKLSGTGTPTFVVTSYTNAPDFNDIGFGGNSPDTGYVVGDSKTLFKVGLPGFGITTLSIPSLPIPASYDLKAVHVFLDNSLVTVGNKGVVVFYDKTDNTYYRHGFPFTGDSVRYNFNDVYFHDDRNGYVVGDTGVVLRWSSSNNIQNINSGTYAYNSFFSKKPTVDLLGASDSTLFNINSIAFPGRYDGMLGGSYPDSISNARYARLVHDESQLFATYFWYDAVGRLVLSQNSKQGAKSPKAYSYTLYDALGRITEVGEKPENTTSGQARFSDVFGKTINGIRYSIINNDSLLSWINAGSRKEVTKTYYDTVAVTSPLTQDNLRKRVSAVTYEDVDDGNASTYNHATFYSYDIHGNVKTLLQDNPSLASIKQRYKKVDYDYDLISGKVNNVYYEHDSLDAFSHHYEYDADNRITEVFTSSYPAVRWSNYQSTFWDRDAKYTYYDHGPLARIEYGNNHVQGADYYYTIQGWIKGVNSNILSATNDGGQDGYNISTNVNKNIARDAYGYTLGYFSGDYSPIDTSKWNTISKRFEANTSGSSLAAARYDLFNGNISQMVTTLIQPDTNWSNQTILPQGTAYKYDQLNRITEMKAFINLTNNAFGTVTYDGRYNNRFSYDANGNILSQVRKNQAGQTFDSLTYNYFKDVQGRVAQNRLYHVNDTISSSVMTDDIDNQGSFDPSRVTINENNNYSYDKIGNLVKDSAEGIATIDWTVYGKIKSVTHRTGYYRLSGTDTVRPPDLVFNYDAAGNRISKVVKPRTATTVLGDTAWTTTHYLRDAQGNVLSIYKQHDSAVISTAYFTQIEKHLYGSSRLGIDNTSTELLGATFSTDTSKHYAGNKGYELSNHLGNVLSVVADRRIPLDTNHNDTIDYYVAYINSSSDYSPFGAPLDGRTFSAGKSRYGFNGKENDRETNAEGGTQDYGMRIYNPALGKFLSVDPITKQYPELTPYQFAGNTPIQATDIDGLEPSYEIYGKSELMPIVIVPSSDRIQSEIPADARFRKELPDRALQNRNTFSGFHIYGYNGTREKNIKVVNGKIIYVDKEIVELLGRMKGSAKPGKIRPVGTGKKTGLKEVEQEGVTGENTPKKSKDGEGWYIYGDNKRKDFENVGGKDNEDYMMFKDKKGDTIEIKQREFPADHLHPGEKGFDEAKNKIIESEKKKDEK